MDILRRIWDLVVTGWDIVITTWNLLCGTGLEVNFQTRRFINTCLIILAINIGLFIVGFALGWSGPVILAAFISSLLVLIGWKASELAVKIISSLGGEVPVVGSVVKPTAEEMKKLLPPLVTVSLFLAFTASIVAIKGIGYFTYSDLLIWAGIILFTAIFTVYINSKVKIVGWVMIIFLYYLLIGNYFWPIQVQGTLDWLERTTVKRAVVAGDATKDHELVAISNNTPLYKFSFGEFKKEKTTTQTEMVAKVVGRKNDPRTKEPMYEVILPVAENLYVGGEIFYVPARLTKLVQKEKSPAPDGQPGLQIPQEKIVHFNPGQPTNSELFAQLGDTIQYINPTAPFQVPGKNQFHEIASTTEHESTGVGTVVIYGLEKEGYVQIKIIPKNI